MLARLNITTQQAANLTLLASLVVLAAKLAAFVVTGSVALLADAAESLVNVAAAVAVGYALRVARRPPDYEHPYGHAKSEYLSSALEGSFILFAAASILVTAGQRLLAPQPIDAAALGIALALFATLVNAATAALLLQVARRHHSLGLRSNATHMLTDVWTSLGTVIAVGLMVVTGWLWLDPLVAMLVGVWIVRTGWSVLTGAATRLLDLRLPEHEESLVMRCIEAEPLVRGFHRLRSRRAGQRRFVEAHLFVDADLTVARAHEITNRIEAAVAQALPNVTLTFHVEPFVRGVRDTTATPRQEFPAR